MDLVIRDTADNNHGIFDDKKLTKVSACLQKSSYFVSNLNTENNPKLGTLPIEVWHSIKSDEWYKCALQPILVDREGIVLGRLPRPY